MVGDVAPRRVADRLDDGLVSGLLLEFEQLRVERGFLGGGNDIGLIDGRIARELGEGLRGRGRGCKQQPRQDRRGQRTKQGSSEEHTCELPSLMRLAYAVLREKKKKNQPY